MSLTPPLAHEPSPGLVPGVGFEGGFTVLRHGARKGLEPSPRRLAQAAIGLFLDLISDRAPQQVAAESPRGRRPIEPVSSEK